MNVCCLPSPKEDERDEMIAELQAIINDIHRRPLHERRAAEQQLKQLLEDRQCS